MGLQKGVNNFKQKQADTVKENTNKLVEALKDIPKESCVSLSKVMYYVAEKTNLHISTIKKNKDYVQICEETFLKAMNVKSNLNLKEILELKSQIRNLELEKTNLNNQIISLSNVIKRLENDEGKQKNSKEDSKYKEALFALLEHFKNQIQIVDGKVIDPYSSLRPVTICKIEN